MTETTTNHRVLRPVIQSAFLLLVAIQSVHSIEEAANRLWEVWEPAAAISGFVSTNPAAGFAFVNSALVLFGFWCYAFPIRASWPSATAFLWFWVLLEAGNGIGHVLLGLDAGGYFPGLVSAPLLLLVVILIGVVGRKGVWSSPD